MISDPYSILGVSPNASDDEIKKAYRALSRKYHPDSYADNPLADLAEEKFKEVQDAYKQIMDERERGQSSSAGGRGGFGGFGGSGFGGNGGYQSQSSGTDSVELSAAANFINSGRYRDAINVLNGIGSRDARWFYYSAVANAGIGNNVQAMNDINRAVSMDPQNPEFRNFQNQLQFRTSRYQGNGQGYGRPPMSTGNCCCDLWIADTCCECMGGDLCACM